METRTPNAADWSEFFALANQEGWRIPQAERDLLQSVWAGQARVLIDSGRFCGLVTATTHEQSGWIGNLLVPSALRGQGYGGFLFEWALQKLRKDKVVSIWLTASKQGKPIYAKAGFTVVDQIERWRLEPHQSEMVAPASGEKSTADLSAFDQRVWQENRSGLLDVLLQKHQAFSVQKSVALLQGDAEMQLIGPWYSDDLSLHSNRQLLQQLVAAADPSVEIVIDLLASSPVRGLLTEAGFQQAGETELMVYGKASQVNLTKMIALASLGSIG